MNLRALANRATSRINRNLAALASLSTGYTTTPSGRREPSYGAPTPLTVQFQALSKPEIQHLDAMNISGTSSALYADIALTGPDRVTESGGDLISFADDATIPADLRGSTWIVAAVLEGWSTSGWCKVAVTRQMP